MIEALLPDRVRCAEAYADPVETPRLFPEEEAVIARASNRRRRDFATVRACAREALAGLGVPAAPILPGRLGAPAWPTGVVGSMTHCEGYRAAVVARAGDLDGLGIDAEPHAPLPGRELDVIARPEEGARLDALTARRPDIHWDRLLFSAKEAVYKTWFPVTGSWLGFDEASIAIDPDGGTFRAHLLPADASAVLGRPAMLEGRWLVHEGIVLTAIALEPVGAALPAGQPAAGMSGLAEMPSSRQSRPNSNRARSSP
ncbi:4'-phosphopantetheinyl transferase [Streptacidiphilus pinicola]|uniref:4'-phosphopantetheinyl transferase n=1 Tax=Streptacidiphilus pinicola TaxID=2219663 RepID=A0A2X0IFP3_9ACTN|nr:4'-phosphopantetheinyl transferase [Streptacidiphilus pinicola]